MPKKHPRKNSPGTSRGRSSSRPSPAAARRHRNRQSDAPIAAGAGGRGDQSASEKAASGSPAPKLSSGAPGCSGARAGGREEQSAGGTEEGRRQPGRPARLGRARSVRPQPRDAEPGEPSPAESSPSAPVEAGEAGPSPGPRGPAQGLTLSRELSDTVHELLQGRRHVSRRRAARAGAAARAGKGGRSGRRGRCDPPEGRERRLTSLPPAQASRDRGRAGKRDFRERSAVPSRSRKLTFFFFSSLLCFSEIVPCSWAG